MDKLAEGWMVCHYLIEVLGYFGDISDEWKEKAIFCKFMAGLLQYCYDNKLKGPTTLNPLDDPVWISKLDGMIKEKEFMEMSVKLKALQALSGSPIATPKAPP